MSVSGPSSVGAIGGMFAARRSNQAANNSLKGGQLPTDIEQLQNLLLPYDQLLQMGRINPTSAPLFNGVTGNQSVLGNLLGGFQNTVAQNDPVFSGLRDTITSGLDLGDSGLPQDVQNRITQNVRASQASRGLLDSSVSAIQEAGALAGGAEQIRAQRINQAQSFLQAPGGLGNAIQQLFPSIGQIYSGELQRAQSGAQAAIGAGGVGAGIYGSSRVSGGV